MVLRNHPGRSQGAGSRLVLRLGWALGLALACCAQIASAQGTTPEGSGAKAPAAKERRMRLTERETSLRVGQYERAQHWALKALVLLSLGRDWHPCGMAAVKDALRSRDPHLRAFGLETLARTSPLALPVVLDVETIDRLVQRELRAKSELVRQRATLVLRCAFPDCEATGAAAWDRAWRERRESFESTAWRAPEVKLDGRSVAEAPFRRALDLYTSGLEVAICIDSTGSMQPTINAAAEAIQDLVEILRAVSPRFRIGLVHYKDLSDMQGGAEVLVPLSTQPRRVKDRLGRLRAKGGGDLPECVEGGLRLSLNARKMGWRRESAKLVVLVGDAPPHTSSLTRCLELATAAYERPFGALPGAPPAPRRHGESAAAPTLPFITSAIGVGHQEVALKTRISLTKVSRAGGGAYTEITLADKSRRASDAFVSSVLQLAFGRRFEEQTNAFAQIYFQYRREGELR